jgi:hypothetical protein
MAIKHTIRKNGNGEFIEVKLTALRAIRKMCIECMGFFYSEIDGCLSPNCPLFPYRYGKTPVGYEIVDSVGLDPLVDGEDAKIELGVVVNNGKFKKKEK